jgi:putative transposase
MKSKPDRKHPARMPLVERHNEPVIVFVTLCSKDRKPIFAYEDTVAAIVNAWREAKSWLVGRYVIMPDHIHLFCAPGVFPREPLDQWVRFCKNLASRNWPRPNEHPIWQRDFWDTQLRRHENYSSKWEYVVANPVRAGLVKSQRDWPFQGELNILRW